MTHTTACGRSKSKRNRCTCSCNGVHHGELRVEDFRKKVILPKMSPELYRETFGDRDDKL